MNNQSQSKHAYLIIAHQVNVCLNTLLMLIDDPRNDIFVHMDKKTVLFKREDLYSVKYSNLQVINNLSVTWGGYSQIECEMQLFDLASSRGVYSYYHLLSGQDLPLKTQDEIHRFFCANQGKQFMECLQLRELIEPRTQYFHFFQEYIGRKRHTLINMVNRVSIISQRIFHIRRNRELHFYVGSGWVSVTDDFVRALTAKKLWIRKIFRFTECCDELYKHTFAMNFGFADKIFVPEVDMSPMVRLINWEKGSPYVWTLTMLKN